VAREVDQIDWHALEAMFSRLEADARSIVAETGLDPASAVIERIADFRYVGQASELVVSLPSGPYGAESRRRLEAAFEASYVEAFTRTPPNAPVEIINIRVTASVDPPGSARALGVPTATTTARAKTSRPVYFAEWREHRQTPVFDRDDLTAGIRIEGPAIVEERSSTLVIAPGCSAEVAASGNVIVTFGQDGNAS
jgi:N-methylhydantoinase A